MSEEEYGHEYFSTIRDVRDHVNTWIGNFKRILDLRLVSLNLELDELEIQVEQDESSSRKVIQRCIDYAKSIPVISVENEQQVNKIRTKIGEIKRDIAQKKIRFDWNEKGIVGIIISLGHIKYEHNQTEFDFETSYLDESCIPHEHLGVSEETFEMERDNKSKESSRVEDREQERSGESNELIFPSLQHKAQSYQSNQYSNLSDFENKINFENLDTGPEHASQPGCSDGNTHASVLNDHNPSSDMNIYHEISDRSIYAQIDEINLTDLRDDEVISPIQPESDQAVACTSKPVVQYDLPLVAKCRQGREMGQLNKPKGVSISRKGSIFVAEKGNNRVQVFSSEGYSLLSFGEKSGPNKMAEPNGIFASQEFVYVTLTNQHLVQMYTHEGEFVRQKGKEGKEKGNFIMPTGIAGDKLRNTILICDNGNNRVQFFDYKLHFLNIPKNNCLRKPLDITVIDNGDYIVLDRSPSCVHFFDRSGKQLREIIEISSNPLLVNPLYLTVSREGHILLSDYSSHCIHVFSTAGNLIWRLGQQGKGMPFEEPRGLACDDNDKLVTVCNNKEDMFQIFKI